MKTQPYFARRGRGYRNPIYITFEERSLFNCLAPGLVDLFTDRIALDAGLSTKWVERLLRRPLSNNATMLEWREHFLEMKREYDRECASA
jgi:hypothetical protein